MKRNITPESKSAAVRLKSAFKSTKSQHGMNSEEAAARLDMTPGAFSQYLNGKIPMNMDFLLRFCAILPGINALDIYPELFDGIDFPTPDDPDGILAEIRKLPKSRQSAVFDFVRFQSQKDDEQQP